MPGYDERFNRGPGMPVKDFGSVRGGCAGRWYRGITRPNTRPTIDNTIAAPRSPSAKIVDGQPPVVFAGEHETIHN